MEKIYINSFINSMFDDKKSFADIHGTQKLFDSKFMLVSDVMSENKELLADAILESLQENQSFKIYTKTDNRNNSFL